MHWTVSVLSAVILTSFTLFWALWSGQVLKSLGNQQEVLEDLRCSDQIILFLNILHYGFLVFLWVPIIGSIVFYLSYNRPENRTLKLDLALGLVTIGVVGFCIIWLFLFILLWLIMWYDKDVCAEADNLAASFLITSSILTALALVIIGFQVSLQRSRMHGLTEEMVL